MDAIECIKTRMSIRKFRPDPVPKETLTNILETALRSPSYKNSQPWEAVFVSGRKKEELTGLLTGLLDKGTVPAPDLPEPRAWPPEIDARIKQHFSKRTTFLGIDVSEMKIYMKMAKLANFRFYGAPHAIFFFQDSSLTLWSILDMGMFAQSLMLAAHANGLGTVPQAFLTDYSHEIKDFLGVPDSKRLMLGMSIGYPDSGDRANSYRSKRVDVSDIMRWLE